MIWFYVLSFAVGAVFMFFRARHDEQGRIRSAFGDFVQMVAIGLLGLIIGLNFQDPHYQYWTDVQIIACLAFFFSGSAMGDIVYANYVSISEKSRPYLKGRRSVDLTGNRFDGK